MRAAAAEFLIGRRWRLRSERETKKMDVEHEQKKMEAHAIVINRGRSEDGGLEREFLSKVWENEAQSIIETARERRRKKRWYGKMNSRSNFETARERRRKKEGNLGRVN